ncbi:MAG: hypothetical protein E7566_05480 [Ruminococcaceae bacterium]|nr:hypothetical protein [Oscillospiraceae bacterium]
MSLETEIKDDKTFEENNEVLNEAATESETITKGSKNIIVRLSRYINPVMAVLLVAVIALSVSLVIVASSVSRLSDKIDAINSENRGIYNKNSQVALAGESDRIYTYNPAYGDVAIPAISGVPVSIYKEENFREDSNGFKYYYEGERLRSYVGVDVSEHNGEIDWQRVKDAGVDFAMLRIGGRGWGEEGVMYADSLFLENLRAARAAGIKVGAYFFSQAVTEEEAIEEAEFSVSLLEGEALDYPLAFDWETIEGVTGARTENISPDILTKCARAFCDKVKAEGYTPCLYTGAALAYYKYDLAQLSDIDLWYAFYNDTPGLYYNYMIWQYTASGTVDGISGNVDLNICFKDY